jgi:hypothetical protein
MTTIPDTYSPATDRVLLLPNTRVVLGSTQPRSVGTLPVSLEQMQSIAVPDGGGVFECTLNDCMFRSFSENCIFLERCGEKPQTMFDLVSPDEKTAVFPLDVGDVVQMKEGDIIVTATDDVFSYGEVDSIIMAVPQLMKAAAIHSLHNPTNLAHIHERVKQFVACLSYNSQTGVVTRDGAKFDQYKQNMGTIMQTLNKTPIADPVIDLMDEDDVPDPKRKAK